MGETPKGQIFSNRLYDVLKYIAQIGLPAAATLYFALAGIWGLPYAEQIVGTIVAVNTFLGITLGLSNKVYKDSDAAYNGSMDIEIQEDGTQLFSLNLDGDPEDLADQKEISFKVNKEYN